MSSQRPNPNVDRISSLPDAVISHILSFLPTKQAAATTILSKKWKNPLWLSLLTLNFDDRDFTDFTAFRLFLYSVMLMRDTTFPLRSFRLKCGTSVECNPHDINLVVRTIVQRGIENLILDFSNTDDGFQIGLGPTISNVFNCRNLVALKLKRLTEIVLPQFDLPLLKTLHLNDVSFSGLDNRYFRKLIESCPILEELEITDLPFWLTPPNEINGVSKLLVNLVRANIYNSRWNIPFTWVSNAKFLLVELGDGQEVNTFHNLTHMELIFESWPTKWEWLLHMLEHCPKLQNLTLHKLYRSEIDEFDWKEPQIVPECISSQLRTCSLIDYKGTECEFQFAKYILKNAKLMHTMTISALPAVDISIKHQMLMNLSLCPRGSTTCTLSFDS